MFSSEENLGVALNFARAENYMFDTLSAEAACFFDDDLILSPHYLNVLQKLTMMAIKEKRIAYVSAYGEHQARLAEQRIARQKLIPMRHKWGYAMTRRQWKAQRDLLEPYIEIVSRANYRVRDDKAIRQYFASLGYGSLGTSQDGMKDVASCVLGTTKIMTFACFGKNIGEIGVHFTKRFYEESKFGGTELFPEQVLSFDGPSIDQLEEWIGADRRDAKQALQL